MTNHDRRHKDCERRRPGRPGEHDTLTPSLLVSPLSLCKHGLQGGLYRSFVRTPFLPRPLRMAGLAATCERCMALPLRSPKAMASTVRSSVPTKSRREQVAEPSSDSAMRLHLSPEQAAPPYSYSLQARSLSLRAWGLIDLPLRASKGINLPSKVARASSICCRLFRKAVQQGRRRARTGGVPSGVR